MLLNVAMLTTFEALLAIALSKGSICINDMGMAGIGGSHENVGMMGLIVLGEARLDVFDGGLVKVGLVQEFLVLFLTEGVGAIVVVTVIHVAMCPIVEAAKA
jgi:hypothetical protein